MSLLLLLHQASGAAPGTTLLQDSFTAANGTAISGRTPTVGATWETFSGGMTIQGNAAVGAGVHVAECGAADVALVATVNASTTYPGIAFRATDANNYWYAAVDELGDTQVVLYEVVGGTPTVRDFADSGATTGPTDLTVLAAGASVIVQLGGVEFLNYPTAASGLAATKHGIYGSFTNSAVLNIAVTAL